MIHDNRAAGALLALIVVGFAVWHCRPTIAAAFDAWRMSRHPNQLGVLRRSDAPRRTQ